MKEHIGHLDGKGLKIGIVVARFNEIVTKSLLEGALDALKRHSVDAADINVAWVPGSFEIPLIAKTMAKSGKFDALICIGALIRGETSHFDYVAAQNASGIASTALDTETPIIYCVLTTDTPEQAMQRAGIKHGNKGAEFAVSAIEMANLMKGLRK